MSNPVHLRPRSPESRAAWRWHEFRLPFVPGRVSAAIGRFVLTRAAPTVIVDLPFGYAMYCDLAEYVQCTIALNGEWEGEIFDACAPLVRAGEVVLDVGAHVGYASLRLAHMTGKSGRVVAFEPLPAHRTAVAAQFELNGIGAQLTLVNAAASDRAGSAWFSVPGGGNAGVGALATTKLGTLTVPTIRLDDWLNEAGITSVALCKMDIEGAEALALAGLSRSLTDGRVRALLLEIHPDELPRFGSSVDAVLAQLTSHGYRLRYWEQPGEFRDGPRSADSTYLLALAPGRAWPTTDTA